MNSNGNNAQQQEKVKVIFVMGATATGKSKLAIDLAAHFNGEIINSDKIQAFTGLDIITNKVTEEETRGVPHHLIDIVNPEDDFTVDDFCNQVLKTINIIVNNGHIPIIAGGSNSYLKKLVEDPTINFKQRFDCCFIWVDVSLPVMHKRVGTRVDQMVANGLVNEVRAFFVPGADYTKGIRRAIGAPEMEKYFSVENDPNVDESMKRMILDIALEDIKNNTRKLVVSQLLKIQRLKTELGWPMHRIDATVVHQNSGTEAEEIWKDVVLKKGVEIVNKFLK